MNPDHQLLAATAVFFLGGVVIAGWGSLFFPNDPKTAFSIGALYVPLFASYFAVLRFGPL